MEYLVASPDELAKYYSEKDWAVSIRSPHADELVRAGTGSTINCVDDRAFADGPAYPGALHGVALSYGPGTIAGYDEAIFRLNSLGLTAAVHGDSLHGEYRGCGAWQGIINGSFHNTLYPLNEDPSKIEEYLGQNHQVQRVRYEGPHTIEGMVVNVIEGHTPVRNRRLAYDEWFAAQLGIDRDRRLAYMHRVGLALVPGEYRKIEILVA